MTFKTHDYVIDAQRVARGGKPRKGYIVSVSGDMAVVQWEDRHYTDEYGSNPYSKTDDMPLDQLVPYSEAVMKVLSAQVSDAIGADHRKVSDEATARGLAMVHRVTEATIKAEDDYRKAIKQSVG
jgi:hypothetical protein